MSNVVEFDKSKMNTALAAALGGNDANDDLSAGVSGGFSVVSFKGSKWRIKHGGEETLVTDADGDLLSYEALTLPEGVTLSAMGVLSGVADRDLLNQLPATATIEVSDGAESVQLVVDIRDERPATNFFSRIIELFRSIFSWLFGR